MFDTVNMKITRTEAAGIDFLSEIPCYLDNVALHSFEDGEAITGTLGSLKVSLNAYQLKVRDGSLCKWYLGSNFQTMGRKDTQRAFEKLSDTLHLPMEKATITRLDLAQNFIVRHPTEVYFSHLGLLTHATRLIEPNGIYYSQNGGRLAFYDKNREQKSKREQIPELYSGKNVLRYEQRYSQRIARQLNVMQVTGAMLYDEAFYIELLNRWKAKYKSIQKINDISLNFAAMKTKKDIYTMGVLSLIEQVGGQICMIEQIAEAQKQGKLTRKQAYDIRQGVNEAMSLKDGLTMRNEAIAELDKKVSEAVRFYR